jgi:hypothetical protein
LKVLLQVGQAERSRFELLLQIERHCRLLVLSGSNVERFDHEARGTVGITHSLQLTPQIAPIIIGE